MYIKQIIIQGFKSYKDQTVIEPFSPGTNVIVGRNGSGKSNFFAAIRFVLSDAYTQMSREERQALLHEGSGSAVMSAYVEIIFDNSDDRFPTSGKEVVIRRTIALKKDEYSVDRKVTPKAEVMSLLESAGFSRSNPYYIVPQGRVTALTNMKESDRLNLLKEVAGTQVYESRRAESLKIMTETNNKREKIDELLEYIKDRLSELEEEKEELRGYQDKDRERRCLEYAHYHHEQQLINQALQDIENSRQDGAGHTSQDREAFQQGEKAIRELEAKLHSMQQQIELLNIDKRQADEDRRETARTLAKAELKAKDLGQGKNARDQAKKQHDLDLRDVKQQIAAKEAELAKVAPEYKKLKSREAEARQRLDAAESARMRLFTKQSRSSQFKNKAERDAFLKKEIGDLEANLGHQKANLMQAQEDVKGLESSIGQLEKETTALRERLEGWGGGRGNAENDLTTAKDALDRLSEDRKRLRREDNKLESLQRNARAELQSAQKILSTSMDSATWKGLETIRRLKRERDIPGAYGTVAELMKVNEGYVLPAEQVAGNSLFHYVVDNADTGIELANALHNKYGGRVTFVPLEQLRPRHINLPRAGDSVPLISKIQYDPMYEKAFQHVFGRTIVCPNLTVAGQYARSHGVDAITPEGDTTNKRGAMTGGYVDPSKSRLEAVDRVTKWQGEVSKLDEQRDAVQQQLETRDQEYTRAAGEVQKLEQQLRQVENGFEPLRAEIRNKGAHLNRERENLEAAHRRRDAVDRNMKDFGETADAHRAEMKTEFKKALTAEEERQLEELGTRVTDLKKAWNDTSKSRREVENRKQKLEVDLGENLQPRLDQLNSQAFENASSSSGGGNLAEAEKELTRARKAASKIEQAFQTVEKQLDDLTSQMAEQDNEKKTREGQQLELATKIERAQKRLEKNVQRKGILTAQAAQCAKSIRDLGVLPDEAFGKYERMESKAITNRLKKVNDALKKYKHVNKKAFDQYASFTTQQDQLLKRREELDTSQQSIEELVAHLDRVKDESIERTFKQVSKEFATIFERLVPAGHGRLVIQRRTDRRMDPDDSDEEQRTSVENYTGVGISVSFNSKHMDEQQRIQQLSGGQKSLCALCLIFALQQTESSPMVIFDEVDANLDAQYRTAVAGLLDSISREAGTQFICTTFRPEIVHIANKCYGVTFRSKTSSIDCVPTEEALNFVEGQQQQKR